MFKISCSLGEINSPSINEKIHFFLFSNIIFSNFTSVSNSTLETKILAKVKNQFMKYIWMKNKID